VVTGALIITDEVTYVGENGRRTPPDAFVGGIVGLLDRVARVLSGVGVVLLDRWAAIQLGLPVDDLPAGGAGRRHPAAEAARAAGWTVREIHRWSVFTREGGTRVAVGLLDQVDPQYCPLVAYAPQDTAARFDAWQQLSGMPWWGDAGDAVNHLILHTASPRWRGRPVTPIWRPAKTDRDGWTERAYGRVWLEDQPPAFGWLHGYDAVRAYLAAMSVVEVPLWLKASPRRTFDPSFGGWWLVESAPWTLRELPDPRGYHPDGWDQPRPLTTPTLTLLAELEAEGLYGGFRVLDSWTGPTSRSVIRPAADRLRQMWDQAAGLTDPGDRDAIRAAVKAGYHAAHGKWRNHTSDIYRPDWAATLVAKARTNLFRKIWAAYKAGMKPAGVSGIDTAWYAADGPDGPFPPHFTEGEGLGQYRRKYSIERETVNA
jgi:hypothetical protein